MILLLENSMRTKLKTQKKSWIFQFLDVRVQWKFHVLKKKIRGNGVIWHLSADIPERQLYFTSSVQIRAESDHL